LVSSSSRSFLKSSRSTKTNLIPSRFCCKSASLRRTPSSFALAAFRAMSKSLRQSRSSLATRSLSAASFASSFCFVSVSAPSDSAFFSFSWVRVSSSSSFFFSVSNFAFSMSFSRRVSHCHPVKKEMISGGGGLAIQVFSTLFRDISWRRGSGEKIFLEQMKHTRAV
jgi:hypothetical protein